MTTPITVAPLTSNEQFRGVIELQRAAWGMDDLSLVPPHILIAVAKAGGMVLGAYAGSDLVGFILGIVSRDEYDGSIHLTSHMMGVHPNWQSRDIGFTLKHAQKTWARTHGIATVRWTFDPMETRNANLNIRKLGGRVIQFVPDYYGTSVGSELQRGLPSDRFVVEWNTELEHQENTPREGEITISISEQKVTPRSDILKQVGIHSAQIPVPLDFQRLKQANFERAVQWQQALREVCSKLFEDRAMWISGFHADTSTRLGYYVLTKTAV